MLHFKRQAAVAFILFASSPAYALDWEIHTATQAQMLNVAKAVDAHTVITDVNGTPTGISAEGALNDGTRFSLYYEGRRGDGAGGTLPGFYLIARIMDNRQMPPAGVTLPVGVTVVTLPATSPQFL